MYGIRMSPFGAAAAASSLEVPQLAQWNFFQVSIHNRDDFVLKLAAGWS